MGDPRRLKKKYSRPMHPWQRETIDAERILSTDYALKNKQELWRMNSLLRDFKNQAKRLIALHSAQAQRERDQLTKRLLHLGLLSSEAKLDDVLSLTIKNVLERRLQSIVHRRGLARTMKQSRQFIIHNHVLVNNQKINAPSYLVLKAEESNITFSPRSTLKNEAHPERAIAKQPAKVKKSKVYASPLRSEHTKIQKTKPENLPRQEIKVGG